MDDFSAMSSRRGKSSKRAKGRANGGISAFLSFCTNWILRFPILLSIFVVAVLTWVAFKGFRVAYYEKNEVFLVAPEDIIVRGNSTISQEYILQCFRIHEPRNAYELLQSDIVARLSQTLPILKDAKMTYTAGGKLEIWVEERMPLARIAGNIRPPLVVDEEGKIFIYSRPTTTYPEIGGFDLPDEELQPGNSLPTSLHCMLRLLSVAADTAEFLPSAVKRVSLLGIHPEDGLKVTLVDGRKIDLAWDDMATETEISEDMVDRLRKVALVLRSPSVEGKTHFNAMAPDRVTVSE